jgi:hypothetical protein
MLPDRVQGTRRTLLFPILSFYSTPPCLALVSGSFVALDVALVRDLRDGWCMAVPVGRLLVSDRVAYGL